MCQKIRVYLINHRLIRNDSNFVFFSFLCKYRVFMFRKMIFKICILLLLLAYIRFINGVNITLNEPRRSFEVDWKSNSFLRDGKPFRFIAGSFHYFRAHPETWQRKLRTLRASGLNAVTTYVEWSLHNPKDGVYVWEGVADVERFIRLAAAEDLLVILRPGPYICAERDLGGFPYWLLNKYPNIMLRTADINYMYEVRLWYSELMARMQPFLYGKGGPIIMVQVENEYGSYFACDQKYREWLRDETLAHVRNDAVLFTNDGPTVLRCGYISGVLPTMDFGSTNNLSEMWAHLRKIQPQGPLVNAEFYPGWLTHWMEPMARVETDAITATFREMLDDGASVNFYMFYGGTNFGFTAGANDGGPGKYQADITSYDYDAPMDEAGDPTDKYHTIREIIGQYLTLPNITVPSPQPKKHYGNVHMSPCSSILSPKGREALATGSLREKKPLTFEALNQYSGLVLYETVLTRPRQDPSVLKVNGIRDRGYVYVDGTLNGILSRESLAFQVPISVSSGSRLQILVENQGRINYGKLNDFKGIISDVFLDQKILHNWNITKFPMESSEDIAKLIETETCMSKSHNHGGDQANNIMYSGPTVFYGELTIDDEMAHDTYLDTTGWGKGIAFVNWENLGRYWPVAGPQVTLYVPREVLKVGLNQIVLIEYQRASNSHEIAFTNVPNFNGPT